MCAVEGCKYRTFCGGGSIYCFKHSLEHGEKIIEGQA